MKFSAEQEMERVESQKSLDSPNKSGEFSRKMGPPQNSEALSFLGKRRPNEVIEFSLEKKTK
jgi:hypothetical protein